MKGHFHNLECNCDDCNSYLKEQYNCKCNFCKYHNNEIFLKKCKFFKFIESQISNLKYLDYIISGKSFTCNLNIDYVPKDKYDSKLTILLLNYLLKLIRIYYENNSKIIKIFLSTILFEMVFSTRELVLKNNKFRVTMLHKLEELYHDIDNDKKIKDKLLSMFGVENPLLNFYKNRNLLFKDEQTIIIKLPNFTCISCQINEYSTCGEVIIKMIKDHKLKSKRKLSIGYKNNYISQDKLLTEVIIDKNIPLYLV